MKETISFGPLVPAAANSGTGTTWDRHVTHVMCSRTHLLCRMGIMIDTQHYGDIERGRAVAQRGEMPCYSTLNQRRYSVSQLGDTRFT